MSFFSSSVLSIHTFKLPISQSVVAAREAISQPLPRTTSAPATSLHYTSTASAHIDTQLDTVCATARVVALNVALHDNGGTVQCPSHAASGLVNSESFCGTAKVTE